jgi:hypothetical protein
MLEVLDNNYNYRLVSVLSALPVYRIAAITPEEQVIVHEISVLGYSSVQIHNKLRYNKPDCILILQDIYNLLASIYIEELDRKTSVE